MKLERLINKYTVDQAYSMVWRVVRYKGDVESVEFIESLIKQKLNRLETREEMDWIGSFKARLEQMLFLFGSGMHKYTDNALARFCELVRDLNLLPDFEGTNMEFCKRVCNEAELRYSYKVPKLFRPSEFSTRSGINKNRIGYTEMWEEIVPRLHPSIQEKIRILIETKY